MWVLTKVGVLGDSGNLVRLFRGVLGGEIIPDPGPNAGYLVSLLSSSCGIPLNPSSKLTRGDRGDRESGDWDPRRIAFDRFGPPGGSVDNGGEDSRRGGRGGGLDDGLGGRLTFG
jgi:hypothetical protein